MSLRDDGRLKCLNHAHCERVLPKDALAGYTCPCGQRHLFLPMWGCCGKYVDRGTSIGDKCPWCEPKKTLIQRLGMRAFP